MLELLELRQAAPAAGTKCHRQGGWNNRIYFAQFRRPEVQDQGVGRRRFLSLPPWLADRCLLAPSSHGLCSVHTYLWCLFLLLEGHQSYCVRAPPYDLIRPPLPPLQAPSPSLVTMGAKASTWDGGDTVQSIIGVIDHVWVGL